MRKRNFALKLIPLYNAPTIIFYQHFLRAKFPPPKFTMLNYPTMWNPVQLYPILQSRIPNPIHTVPSNQTRHFFFFKFTIFTSPAPEQLTYLIPPYERALTRRPFTVCSRIVPFDWDRGRFLNGIASYVEQHISCRMFSTWKVEGRREGGEGRVCM